MHSINSLKPEEVKHPSNGVFHALSENRAMRDRIRRVLGSWQLYVLVLPAMLYLFLFNYLPMYGIQIAFKDYRTNLGIWDSAWVGLRHFRRFVEFPNFGLILANTARIGLYSLVTFPLPVMLALMINEISSKAFKKTVQMITYMPYFLSTVVVCSMIILFLDVESGIVNRLLALGGLQPTPFLTTPRLFDDIYVWSEVWKTVGWDSIIYMAVLSNVPMDLISAARVDGANRLQTIRHVHLPSIIPTVVIILILSSGRILQVGFEKVYLLQNPLNLTRSQVISTYVYQIGIVGAQFSYASAIGLFNTAINLFMLLAVNRIARKLSEVSIW